MENKFKIGIIGLGYVGLPLAIAFSKHFKVIGFDVDSTRILTLNKSIDSNGDIDFVKSANILFTDNSTNLSEVNVFIVTVPTPVTVENIPDLSILKNATNVVAEYLKKDDIVVFESTVYPGVTEEVCVPILENNSRLNYNVDFFCAYSPERISPGADKYSLENVVKITSGSTIETATTVDELYEKIIKAGTYKAPSIKVAEAAKVVENIQRDVNIALMNELSMMFDKMNIETSEVLNAARTKWNFLDFKPGLVGGHCIGVDPYYLLHKSEKMGYKPTLLHSSRTINNKVAAFVVDKTISLLEDQKISVDNSKVLILGYTFKENCADTRNTKVKDIVDGLKNASSNVSIYDPYLSESSDNYFINNPFESDQKYDAIILAVAHNEFLKNTIDDFNQLSKGKLVFLDLKGIYKESSWKL
jgi:UDP-N-acetyl-D-galactosamine dehydrogenase